MSEKDSHLDRSAHKGKLARNRDVQQNLDFPRTASDVTDPDISSSLVEELSEVLGLEIEPDQAARILKLTSSRYSFTGPIPPPHLLRQYADILQDDGNRIVVMAEREQEHRHDMDRRETSLVEEVTKQDLKRADRGQWLFFGLVILFVSAGLVGMFLERPLGGLSGLVGALATALFGIYGPSSLRLNRFSKEKEEA